MAISNLIRLLDLPEEALELIETGELSEGHGRAILLCKDHGARRAPGARRRATAPGRCARPSAARARPSRRARARAGRAVLHPDLAEALAAAEDALSAALGREVKARARGERCVVELEFDSPAEAVTWPARCSRRGARRAA